MSKQLGARIRCNNCNNQFDTTLYRSLWIEDPSNLRLVLEDKVNVITCPHCKVTTKAEVPLLCTNVKRGIAVWYEPYPDAAVEADVKEYAKHFGPRSFYAVAPRIRTWPEFKAKILEMGLQGDGVRSTVEISSAIRNQFDGFMQDVRKEQQVSGKKPPANQTSLARKLFWRVFPPLEVTLTLAAIDAFLSSARACRQIAKRNARAVARHAEIVVQQIRVDRMQPDELALTIIINLLAQHISSGSYHAYRGLLGIVGTDMHVVFSRAVNTMLERGYYTEAEAREADTWIREQIKSVG